MRSKKKGLEARRGQKATREEHPITDRGTSALLLFSHQRDKVGTISNFHVQAKEAEGLHSCASNGRFSEKRRPGDGKLSERWQEEEGGKTAICERAFSARAAVKPAVSTNVRNIYLHELNPAYTL